MAKTDERVQQQAGIQRLKSACPLNCWDACGFVATVADNKLVKLEGDPDHPVTKGKICGRGKLLLDKTNHQERLLHPLKKVSGRFIQISWQQALDEIAEKLLEIKQTVGPLAVFHSHDYANSGLLKQLDQRFFNCYGGITENVGSLCWGAGIEAQLCDFGNALSHAPEDLYNSKTIVVWGRNITTTNMHLLPYVQEAQAHGARLIVIDPLPTGIAKLADHHIKIKPGLDGNLALLVAKGIIEQNLQDQDFLEKHTHGFERFYQETLQALDEQQLLKELTITNEELELLIAAYAQAKPTATLLGLGMQRYKNGGNTIRAIDALVAISGNIGIAGGGANYAQLSVGQSFTGKKLTLPERKSYHRAFTRMTQAEEILMAQDPPINMLFVTRGNPLTQVPDTHKLRAAFEGIETKVVIDMFMTDTAALADYVLPCTTVFEEEDIYYASMFHGHITYAPQLVQPQGECKPDREIWTELAQRLGFGADFDYSVDTFLNMGLQKLNRQGITLERLKQEHTVQLPIADIPWSDYHFATRTGKFEFYSERLQQKGLDPMIRVAYPETSEQLQPELAQKYPYLLLSIHPQRSLHSQHYVMLKETEPIAEISSFIAEQKNLKDGEWVEVYNQRGKLKVRVKIKTHMQPETICIEEGRWEQFGGSVNQLTPDSISDIGLGGTMYDCRVQIRRIEQ